MLLVDDGRSHGSAIDACPRHCSPLQRIPGGRGRLRRHLLPLMPWAVERLRPRPCRLLLSTSSAVMKSIRLPAGAVHVCYCHSPARYAWDQADDYAVGQGGRVRRAGLAAIGPWFRRWDRRTADRVHQFVANSRHTADRIRRCYGREAIVVCPPARTDFFTPGATPREPWFLVVAALEPYKRTDLVIEAAERLGVPLRIAGSGSQHDALAARAAIARGRGVDVQMLGRVDDEELRELYRRARGLVFPQVEDFGIVPVEAMACGCPVVAVGAGGVLDTVDETVGVLVAEQSADAIGHGMSRLIEATPDPATCRRRAEGFSGAVFDAAMDAVIATALAAGG
jgi:glycosyltransferase involved in cell wall biosynthesis